MYLRRIILFIPFFLINKGKYILPDKTVKLGVWEDGKRIKWIDSKEEDNTEVAPK